MHNMVSDFPTQESAKFSYFSKNRQDVSDNEIVCMYEVSLALSRMS